MKKEIISFIIGAGIVGTFWIGSAFYNSKQECASSPEVKNVQKLNLIKKSLNDVYSAAPDKNFPGLKLFNTDFLVPLNRLQITEHAVFDDPKADYGSGNAPMSAFMFRIEEKGKHHYFMTSGRQWATVSELVYLGENIELEKVESAGNGYIMATYKNQNGKTGRAFVAVSYITGSDPTEDVGVAQNIPLDPLLKYAENCDPLVWKISAEELWKLLQKSLQENDKMTIAGMITFPMDFRGERIYTRAEFVKRFDEIFYPEYKEFVLKSSASEIWYSWRGAGLPDRCSWCREASKSIAGPLSLHPDRLLVLQEAAGK